MKQPGGATVFLVLFGIVYIAVWLAMLWFYFWAPIEDFFDRLVYAGYVRDYFGMFVNVATVLYVICMVPKYHQFKSGFRFWLPVLIFIAANLFLEVMDTRVLDNQSVLKFYYHQK